MTHIPLPVFLPLAGRKLVIVGGGDLALRKLRLALKTGADIHVVSPEIHADIEAIVRSGKIAWADRAFDATDVEGASAVFAATGIEDVDSAVSRAAGEAGVPVNAVDRPEISSFTMGSIVDRAPMVIGISTDGAAPVLARRVKTLVEQAIPERIGDVAAFARRFRDTVRRLVPTERARRAFWESFVDGPVARLVLAGREPEARAAMIAEINGDRPAPAFGKVLLVGAGPGDPELLTIKAARALQEADVILHDRLVPDAVLEHARRDADRISVGKTPGGPSVPQEETNELMASLAEDGKTVVRLKAGDPFIFGRGGEERAFLEARGIQVEIVPGITAAVGCAAEVGLPLTHRDHTQTVTFVTAHGRDGDPGINWPALAALKGTIAVYMGVRQAPATERQLLDAGLAPSTPVAIAQNGTQPGHRLVRGRIDGLASLVRDYTIDGPAIIYIGETAALGIPGEEADAIHTTTIAASERRAIAGA